MGIKQLSKLIKENTKNGVIPRKMDYYSSCKIAIDASMSIYQFLIAVRSDGSNLGYGDSTTSHLVGMFYRTIRMVEAGIIPVYVFDGQAPALKVKELQRRLEKREKADKQLEEAIMEDNKANIQKFEKRKTKVEGFHNEECKKLLKLMGIPFVTAVSEAEAYCSYLCKNGSVKGVATEDMDTLCFGSPILLRNMNASQASKLDIEEYNLSIILKELDLPMDAFIDLCILMGCDYCDTIKGIGPKRALELIRKKKSIENILEDENLDIPENFDFKRARSIFKELSEVGENHNFSIEYDSIDKPGLIDFLCKEKGFDETRVSNGIDKILNSKSKKKQLKLDAFFSKKQ